MGETGTSRRDVIKKVAVGAGVVWATPAISTTSAWGQAAGSGQVSTRTPCCQCKTNEGIRDRCSTDPAFTQSNAACETWCGTQISNFDKVTTGACANSAVC